MIPFLHTRFLVFITLLVFLFSCRKESVNRSSEAYLYIQADTIKFDTVFTSIGSVTQSFKIINENDQKIELTSIRLMGGDASAYNININGYAGNYLNNIEIDANDSMYVFVSVTIDPNSKQLPFIVKDSIEIKYNGNVRQVQLEAFGQNAHFYRNKKVSGFEHWTNDIPYVILGGLNIDTLASLTIEKGCKVYVHANAPIIIDGTLITKGEKNNEVVFTGDRLDQSYRNLPASWPGIFFRGSSKKNELNFSIIKNAVSAIRVEGIGVSTNPNPTLVIHQCIIDNASKFGIYGVNTGIDVDNTLISNCGKNIDIHAAGDYHFSHCTVASYSTRYATHKDPVLNIDNFPADNTLPAGLHLKADFKNCIFWGDEFSDLDEWMILREGANLFEVAFTNCIYKNTSTPINCSIINCLPNTSPMFDSVDVSNHYFDFRTSNPLAPGIDQGVVTSFAKDLDDNNRISGLSSDIGCYEKQ